MKTLNIKKTFLILSFLSFLFFSYAFAYTIPCPAPDIGKNCGAVNSYNIYTSCSLSGSDIYGGNRILGGQKCVIGGGTDFAGYRMDGTSTPTSSTPTISLGDGVAPGWTYSKTGELFASGIPTGEWTADIYHIYRFFGGAVTSILWSADDESMLQIGSSYSYWTGCNSDGFRSVFDASCPAKTFMGSNSTTANPGDPIIFSVQNDLRPNNGSGTWASGDASITLQEVTACYTSAYKIWQGGYNNTKTFNPTAAGVCTDLSAPVCAISTFTCSSNTVAWSTSNCSNVSVKNPSSSTISTLATGSSTPVVNGVYTLTTETGSSTATCSVPVPAINAKWVSTGTDTMTINLTPGQNSITVPFDFWNSGASGSTLNVTGCPPTKTGPGNITVPPSCQGTLTVP
ncbi:MAG: hypothetical protein WC884_01455 [Candidatus Paceibacterota bacterium]